MTRKEEIRQMASDVRQENGMGSDLYYAILELTEPEKIESESQEKLWIEFFHGVMETKTHQLKNKRLKEYLSKWELIRK